jgi:hypothetical protein
VQRRPRPFAFEHGQLLSEGEDLKSGIASMAKEDAKARHERKDGCDHKFTFYHVERGLRRGKNEVGKLLISYHEWILTTDRQVRILRGRCWTRRKECCGRSFVAAPGNLG